MRISDWSSDVCSSDLLEPFFFQHAHGGASVRVGHADDGTRAFRQHGGINGMLGHQVGNELIAVDGIEGVGFLKGHAEEAPGDPVPKRSEEHTSELQSHMRISYAVFCLKQKNT